MPRNAPKKLGAAACLSLLVVLAACGGSGKSTVSTTVPVGKTVRVVFRVPRGTASATVDDATKGLERRLAELTRPPDDAVVTSYAVRRGADGIEVETDQVLDRDVLAALAAPTRVTWRPVVPGTPVPPCATPTAPTDPGQPVVLPSPPRVGVTLCYELGPAVNGTDSIRTAHARKALKDWVVDVTTSPAVATRLGAAATSASGRQMALIADDRVVAAPALPAAVATVRIEGELRRGQAKGLAAALGGGPLPVALGAPTGPEPERPIAGVDHWVAPLAVNVCGQWLANAPQTDGDIHSHGDGFVHIHPFHESGAGAHATLGAFFRSGGWEVTGEELRLWDHRVHHNGATCNGKRASVRWTVNGKTQSGNPSNYRPRDNDLIVITFVPEGVDVGRPPIVSTPRPPL